MCTCEAVLICENKYFQQRSNIIQMTRARTKKENRDQPIYLVIDGSLGGQPLHRVDLPRTDHAVLGAFGLVRWPGPKHLSISTGWKPTEMCKYTFARMLTELLGLSMRRSDNAVGRGADSV